VIRNLRMNRRKRFPIRLAVGLVLAVVIDTALQLVWKTAVSAIPDNGPSWINFQALLRDPLSLCVVAFMLCYDLGEWLANKFIGMDYSRPKEWMLFSGYGKSWLISPCPADLPVL
jgi:hypothetical protein